MKLHLPKGLRTALFACFAAFAGIGATLSTATLAGGVFAVTIAGQAAAADYGDGAVITDALGSENVNVTDGTVTVSYSSSGTGFTTGEVHVSAGATLKMEGSDTLGWGGGKTSLIALTGTDENNVATFNINSRQTMSTNITLNGYAQVVDGADESSETRGSVNPYGCVITANNDYNVISAGISLRSNVEFAVNGSLQITGGIWHRADQGGEAATFTKTGTGTLTIDALAAGAKYDTDAGSTTSPWWSSVTYEKTLETLKGFDVRAGEVVINREMTVGNLSVAEGATFTSNAALTLSGTLTLAGSSTIELGAGASLSVKDLTIDVSQMASTVQDGKTVYTLLTGAGNLDLSGLGLTADSIIGLDSSTRVWTFGTDGTFGYAEGLHLVFSGSSMNWGGANGDTFDGDVAYVAGADVTFSGTSSTVTVTGDVETTLLKVTQGADVTLNTGADDQAYTITARSIENQGTLTIAAETNVQGNLVNDGSLTLDAETTVSDALVNNGTLTVQKNSSTGSYDANSTGTLNVATGAEFAITTLTGGENGNVWKFLTREVGEGMLGTVVIGNEVNANYNGTDYAKEDKTIYGRFRVENNMSVNCWDVARTTTLASNALLHVTGNADFLTRQTIVVEDKATLQVDGTLNLGATDNDICSGRLVINGADSVVALGTLNFKDEVVAWSEAQEADQNASFVHMSAGRLIIGSGGITAVASSTISIDGGTLASGATSWSSTVPMVFGTATVDTTKQVMADGVWTSSATEGSAITLSGAVTVNGTLDVTGAGTLTMTSVSNNGVINVSGTLGVVDAITMGADAEFNVLGGKIDLSQMTAVGGVYTLLTATDATQANLDLSGKLTTDNLTGFAGNMEDYEWSFNSDGTISYSSTNVLRYAGGSLTWADAATGFESGKIFSQGAPVIFQGDTTATLAENIESDELKVESNVTLTLVDADVEGTPAGNKLTVDTVKNEGTIDSNVAFTATTLLNKGTFEANAALSAGSLTNDGSLEVNADSSVTTYDAASTGTYMVATGKKFSVGSKDVALSSQTFTSLLAAGRSDDTHTGTTEVLGKQSNSDWGLTYMKDLSGTLDISAAYDVTSLGKLMLQTAADSTMTTTLNAGGMLEASQLILTSGQTFIVKDGAVLKTNGISTESLFVQNGATLMLEGGSIIAQTLRESTDALGGTFSMTGGSLALTNSLVRTQGSFSLLGGSLKTVDSDGWSMSGEVTLGSVTIDAANAAAITVNGPIIFAGTVDNDSSLVIGATGATPVLSVAGGDLSQLTFEKESTGRTSGNGFAMGTYWLVDGRDATSSLTLNVAEGATGAWVTVGDDSYQVTAADGSLSFSAEALGGDYYINENSETYGGANATIPTDGLENIILRDATLVMGADWDASANNTIRVMGQSTISLEEGVTLKGHDAFIADQCTLTLEGSGTYVLRSVDDIPLLTSLKDSTAWTGTVDLYCDDHGGACNLTDAGVTVAGQDLNVLGNAASTVVVRGTTGYFAAGDVNTNVTFGTTGADVPALTISGTTGDYGLNITGKISGEGSVVIANDNTGKVSLGLGDTSGWTGSITANATTTSEITFNVVDNQVINTVVNGNADVTYQSVEGGRITLAADSKHTGKTTINGIGVDLGESVTSIGSEVVLESGDLTVQGNQLAADVSIAQSGEVKLLGGASISSLTIASQAGGTLYVSDGAGSITGDLTVAADAGYNRLALSDKLTVGGEVSGLTSLYINDAKTNQLVADTFTLGATQSLAVEVVGGNLSTSEVGTYTLVSAETLNGVLEDQLSLLVSGTVDTVTDNGDGSFTVGQIRYTLDVVDNSIVLTGAFHGISWNDSDGDVWSKDATDGFAVVPGAGSMVSFEGSDTVTIDGSQGAIEVGALRVDTAQAPGYTFTGSSAETDRIQVESLVIAQGDVALDKVGVEAGTLIVGQSSGVAAGLEVREGSAVTAGEMTAYAGSGKGLVINAGGTVDVAGAFKTDEGVTIINQGALSMGMGSSVAAIAGVDGKTGTITATTGTVNVGSIAGTVENLTVGMSANLKVGSDVTANALNIARGGNLELSTTDATTGDTSYHNLALQSASAVTVAGSVTAASVDLSGVSAAGNSFGSLTTDKITLDVTTLSAGASLLHIETLTKLTPATAYALDATGGVELELTGIPSDLDAETAVGAVDARDWAKGFAEGEYTLLSYGSAVDGLTLTTPSLANIQQLFALDGMDASFVEQTANGVTNVVLTLSSAANREWSSDEPNWAGDPDQATGEVKLGIDLLTGRPTLAVSTYDAFNTVQKVTMKGDYTIDLSETTDAAGNPVDIAMTSETDPDRGLVIRELDGTGTLTLVGSSADSGNPADVATLINKSADQVLTGDLAATNMTVNVESAAGADGAKLTVSGITLNDSALNILGTGKLATTGDTSVTNGSLKVEDGGEFSTGDMTLSGDAQVTNNGTLTAGVVTLSDAGSKLNGAAGTTTVESINGTAGTLAGTISVTGQGGDYSGSYENATVELAAGADQTLAAGAGLSLSGSNASATLISTDAPVTMDSIDVTDTNITLFNMGADGVNTLTVTGGSGMTGGVLAFDVSSEGVMAGDDQVVTSGLGLDGTTVLATSTTPIAPPTFDVTQDTDGMTLFTLENSGVSAADVTLMGDFFLRYFDPNSLTVVNGAVKADLITDYYTSRLAETENGTTGMQMLDMAFLQVNPQTGDLSDVIKSLDHYVQTNNVAAADKLAAAVAGSGVASLGMAVAGDVERQLKAIRNRTTSMGVDPAVVNEDMPYFNAWINAEGDHRSLDEDSTYAGYSLSSWGGTVGFDMDVNPNLTWGLAITAMYGDFTGESPDTVEGDMSTYYVSAFARATRGAWVHTFVATLGKSNTELTRTVSHKNGSYTTEGDADGMSFGLLYEVGRTYALNEDATACWQPVFNVAYRHTQVDSFSETGSDAALRFGEQTLDTVTFGLGGRVQAVVGESLYNRTSIFEARALLKLDAGDRESEVESAMLSASAARGTLKSAEMDAFGLELGAGITVPMGMDSGSIFADASIEFRGSYTSVNGTFGYRLNF